MTTDDVVPVIGLVDALDDPYGVAEYLVRSGCVYGLVDSEVRVADPEMVVLWITLEPWAPMAERGYPAERVSIAIWPGGWITAVPSGATTRPWRHRFPYVLGDLEQLGQLCLWYPDDPRGLRWEWADGLVSYVTIVHRHLQAEEYCRRTGSWPAEEAPHGQGKHPILTPALQQATIGGTA